MLWACKNSHFHKKKALKMSSCGKKLRWLTGTSGGILFLLIMHCRHRDQQTISALLLVVGPYYLFKAKLAQNTAIAIKPATLPTKLQNFKKRNLWTNFSKFFKLANWCGRFWLTLNKSEQHFGAKQKFHSWKTQI